MDIQIKNPEFTLETDACETTTRERLMESGQQRKHLHINVLGIKVILFGLKAFFSDVWNSHFFIYTLVPFIFAHD